MKTNISPGARSAYFRVPCSSRSACIVVPVVVSQLIRKALLAGGKARFQAAVSKLGPYSISALLLTLVLLFAFQGHATLAQPLVTVEPSGGNARPLRNGAQYSIDRTRLGRYWLVWFFRTAPAERRKVVRTVDQTLCIDESPLL
ncbi:hypothetical protein RD110_01110 [Rhodoferax koreense]|uniref:Uncharacterized protein n=1 Tax=Rhodoferax koreensis TaxID=1842727 RepID=A0A1P8JQH3_9BURK|nr:hypothetical protein RD110_01110 [Rhodoferax koreense]